LGVALYPEDATNLAELTRCADKAMYSAKHNGKNQFHYYHRKESTIEKKTILTNVDNVTPLKHRTP
jgi:predicted signal transduction protein with EAL and GGDEF domain